MKLKANFVRLSMLVSVFLLGTAAFGNAQSKIHISGYGNTHYMDHNGMPVFVGKRDMNNGFFQIREFSLFFDIAITDRIIASTELEASIAAILTQQTMPTLMSRLQRTSILEPEKSWCLFFPIMRISQISSKIS